MTSDDEKAVKKSGNRDKRKLRKRRDALKSILEHESGRSFVWWLLGECGIFTTSFDTHSNRMSFNEGERNVGLKLQAEVFAADPDAYMKMMNEAKREERRDD